MTARSEPLGTKLQLDIAGALIVRSRVFLEAWFLSAGAEGRSTYREFWNEAWSFWRFNEHALLFSFIIHMTSLFERRNDTVNLYALWASQQSHPRAKDIENQVLSLFRDAAPAAKGLTILRSNVMAHRSTTLSYNDAFEKAQITPNAMRELTEQAITIVNAMRTIHDFTATTFDELAIDDLKAIASLSDGGANGVEITDYH